MIDLDLIFDSSNKFYFEGEKVRVKLQISVDNFGSVKNIVANFVGLGMVLNKINEKQKNSSGKSSIKNLAETYFDELIPLYVLQSEEAGALLRGTQVFKFEYQLPQSLPTSIETDNGFIRYSIHVKAEVSGEIVKITEHFTVVSKIDLNKDMSLHVPCVLWKPENQCFLKTLLCNIGPVRAFLHIPKKGYVPGEYLFINAEICNFHRFPIEWVKASLIQIFKYKCSKPFTEKRTVVEVTRGSILPSEIQSWQSEALLIPALPPTTCEPTSLMQVKYKLSFQYKTSWNTKPVELKQKIHIGVVKLLECENQLERNQGKGEGAYNSQFYNASSLEPCVFGPHVILEDGKSSSFSPLYPVYVAP